MKIGLFTDTYEPDINGVATSVGTLKNALEKLGHEVFVITNHNRLFFERRGNILFLPGIELKKLYGYTMSFLYSMKASVEIKKLNLDIIHVHTEFGVGIFGRIIAKEFKIPIIATYHTAYEDYTHYVNKSNNPVIDSYSKKVVRSISKLYVNSVDAVISPSEKTEKMLRSYGVKKPIYVIPTGLPLARFKKENVEMIQNIKQEYGIEENENLAIFVGRIAAEKNIEFVIEAFQYINNGRLMIVGDGPQLAELKKYAKELHIFDKIIFTGKKENSFIAQYYKCADCFVSASTSETQGMTYIEAMAAGLVVFAQKDEAVERLINEDNNGYFFGSPKELADKMTSYFELPLSEKNMLKQNAIDSVEKYDELIFGEEVEKAYKNMLEKKIKILDVRFENDKIHLWTTSQEVDIDLDTYIEYHLRKGLEIDEVTWHNLLENNQRYVAYNQAVQKISYAMKSEYEIRELLYQIENIDEDTITFVIEKLKKHRLLDDEAYAEAFVNSYGVRNDSNATIMRKLETKGIFTYDFSNRNEAEVALAYAEKLQKTTMRRANHEQLNYIRKHLYQKNFNYDSIKYALDNLTFEYDEEKEKEALKKVYEKAQRLYGRYSGFEKTRRIKLYLRQKGFSYDDIDFEEEE